jgi:hypothetical protein
MIEPAGLSRPEDKIYDSKQKNHFRLPENLAIGLSSILTC